MVVENEAFRYDPAEVPDLDRLAAWLTQEIPIRRMLKLKKKLHNHELLGQFSVARSKAHRIRLVALYERDDRETVGVQYALTVYSNFTMRVQVHMSILPANHCFWMVCQCLEIHYL